MTTVAPEDSGAAPITTVRPDHRSFRCVLRPSTAAVGLVTKAELILAPGLQDPLPRGAPMPVVARVVWQGFAPHLHRWYPLPDYAKPFPWDPHTIVPNVDFVGLRVRAVVILVDPETEKPVVEYEGDRAEFQGPPETYEEQASRSPSLRVRPRQYTTEDVVVKLPTDLAAAADRVAHPQQSKFGFHCSIGSSSNQRLVVLVYKPTPKDPCHVVLEAVEMPDGDAEPTNTLWKGVVDVTPDAPHDGVLRRSAVCDLHVHDQVTLTLHVDQTVTTSADAAATVDGNEEGRTFAVVLRTARDRDMVALCIRALVQAAAASLKPTTTTEGEDAVPQ